jgi:hypothetical protein
METMENAVTTEQTTAEQTSPDLDAGWDDAKTAVQEAPKTKEASGEKAEAKPEPQPQTAAAAADKAKGAPEGTKPAEQPEEKPNAEKPAPEGEHKIRVKYLDQERELGEEEAVALAQKGLDYDRIRAKYDENKPSVELIHFLADQSKMTVPEFVTFVRKQTKLSQGMDEASANRFMELEDREAEVSRKEEEQRAAQAEASKKTEEQRAQQEAQQADFRRFAAKYPDVKPETIPREVWDAVKSGASLTEAYQEHLFQKLAAENEALKQSAKNAGRSAGSMQSAGADNSGKNPLDEGWDT